MPNKISSLVQSARSRIRFSRPRRSVLAVGSVLTIAAIVATGFAAQTTAAERVDRESATTLLSESTGLHSEQLWVYGAMLDNRAVSDAERALAEAAPVIEAAEGKTDAATLAAITAQLERHENLSTNRIFDLTRQVTAATVTVQQAIAEADRVAAEKAAAQRAATMLASSRPAAPIDPSGAQAIARDMMLSLYGWGDGEFGCLVALWNKESGWNANAYNASSGAAGIPQAMPGSKMASAGADWQTNPATQIKWGLGYISSRYATPCGAWNQSQSAGWY